MHVKMVENKNNITEVNGRKVRTTCQMMMGLKWNQNSYIFPGLLDVQTRKMQSREEM